MKCLVYEPNSVDVTIKDKEMPIPKKGEIILKVDMAGICGSDIVAWKGGFQRISEPVILGHEVVGTIFEVPMETCTSYKKGDRVVVEPLDSCGECEACRNGNYNVCTNLKVYGIDADGCFAEYMVVRADRIHKIPDELSLERAAMCECVSVAVHIVKRSNIKFGDNVAISGAGPIGILSGLVALRAGANKVVITDMNKYRLNLAKELGMIPVDITKENYIDEIYSNLNNSKADVALELVGVADALNTTLEVIKSRGTLLTAGMFKEVPVVEIQKAILKEVDIVGSRVYKFKDFESAINLLKDKSFPIEKVISKVVDLEDMIIDGMNPIRKGEDLMKVLVKCKSERSKS